MTISGNCFLISSRILKMNKSLVLAAIVAAVALAACGKKKKLQLQLLHQPLKRLLLHPLLLRLPLLHLLLTLLPPLLHLLLLLLTLLTLPRKLLKLQHRRSNSSLFRKSRLRAAFLWLGRSA
ncbi:hypothetical protein LP414_00925 [Polaromonas sp. P1(28)-13]|nr:hypothetical protein LP414_00925 [Polaromonas sp. P1(28)-13]